MIDRVAFFASKENFEDYFNLFIEKEAIFDPHYNLAPSHEIPILLNEENGEKIKILRARWGFNNSNNGDNSLFNIRIDKALKKLQSQHVQPCIVPVSGYYIWKDNDKKKQPFFVRMLNESVMAIAGLAIKSSHNNSGKWFCSIIITDANALIHPITESMPLIFTSALATTWLTKPDERSSVLLQADKLFLLTEMTVHRVSKKVTDIKNNSPKLIQPIPK
ncbi:MAG: SOS response-associated peptidase [Balneolaceae bacterium]